jgi:hypothetical protein
MIKAYASNRKVYYIFDKKETSSKEALKQAAADMKFSPLKLKVSSADIDSEDKSTITYTVERSKGAFWCVSRR